ncbi:hypothetical protein [Dactylosporangium sp. NPDC000521]|uniref:hypothetical protein n=1 Tax=Dactylosporangium sp. NPDC000521 TaxID=3363975 RepID=UPI0036C110A2
MAAIIAGHGHGHGPGNADGILGIAPKVKILPIRMLDRSEEPTSGASVISASLEIMSNDAPLWEAVARAIDKGVVVVASTENDHDLRLAPSVRTENGAHVCATSSPGWTGLS